MPELRQPPLDRRIAVRRRDEEAEVLSDLRESRHARQLLVTADPVGDGRQVNLRHPDGPCLEPLVDPLFAGERQKRDAADRPARDDDLGQAVRVLPRMDSLRFAIVDARFEHLSAPTVQRRTQSVPDGGVGLLAGLHGD